MLSSAQNEKSPQQGEAKGKIAAGMSDAERYEILKNRKVRVASFNQAEYQRVVSMNPELPDKKIRKSTAEKLLRLVWRL